MKWSSLHHHSTFSYMDGFGTPEQHIERAVELDMPALALTEHGNTSSHVRLEKAAVKAGIKPIFGCELYTGAVDAEQRGRYKWHLTVLAENLEGYRNLLKLVSMGWAEGFHYEPTVSGEMLAAHSEGLIVLSGCAGSKLVCDLLGGKGVQPHDADLRSALATAQRFKALLGNRYYLEAQAFPELERTCATNDAIQRISAKTGIPIVATGDVHYMRPEESDIQVILHTAGRGGKNNTFEKQQQSWGYNIKLSPPLSDAVLLDRMIATGMSRAVAQRALHTSVEIADRCNVTLPKAERLRFPYPEGHDARSLFRRWLRDGWNYRSMDQHPKRSEAVGRIKYEMEMIEAKDFVDYFLMLSDVVRFAKDNGVAVGPARGSAAASLACYLLRITEVDPLMFPAMVFERFIDVTREDLPDVDLDFDDDMRYKVYEHLVDLYGVERVGNIGNFVRYRGKNAIDDVARVFQLPYDATETVKNLVIERSGGDSRFDASLEDTVGMFPQAKAAFDSHPELWNAVALEGNMRGMSVHAAGLVVANTPITDFCALYTREIGNKGRKRQVSVLSVDKYDAEYLNVLKVDVLGLSTMGMIRLALEEVGIPLADLYAVPLDDPITLKAFKEGDVVGIFQFEGRATRLVNADVSPDNFSELADINALSRPGPLFSGATAAYVDTKHGRVERRSFHPAVDRLTGFTHGQIIYQEQILQIVREVGGFPWTHASAIRKIISQKKGEAAFNEMQDMFLDGAMKMHGISRSLGLDIWKQLVTSGTYAFNVAHCVSYSMLGFWCMWLKQHHPVAFYMASLLKVPDDKSGEAKRHRILRDAARHGIEVAPPHPNRSGRTWTTAGGRIQAGYEQVKGIGESIADDIIADRDARGAFADWEDLLRVKGIGPAKMDMIRATAGSDDPFGLLVTGRVLDEIRAEIENGELPGLPPPTHRSGDIPTDAENLTVIWLGVVRSKDYADYIEDQRARTGDEIADIIRKMKYKDRVTSCKLQAYDDGDEEVYLRFDRVRSFPRHKEALESLVLNRDVVLVIGKKKKGFGVSLHVEKMWIIDPTEEE